MTDHKSLWKFRRPNARWMLRYWILRGIYSTIGLVDVPFIGPKIDGKRDCLPGLQAQADVFGWSGVVMRSEGNTFANCVAVPCDDEQTPGPTVDP